MTPFVYNTSVTTKEDVEVIVVRLCDRSVLFLCRRVSTMALIYFCEKDALKESLMPLSSQWHAVCWRYTFRPPWIALNPG